MDGSYFERRRLGESHGCGEGDQKCRQAAEFGHETSLAFLTGAVTAAWAGKMIWMLTVQIFGLKNSQATRAAERFFKERRFTIHMVDLKQKPMSAGEIRRFTDRFKLAGIVDTEGKAWVEAGLKYMKMSDSDLLARIERDPSLLLLPLVRSGNRLAVGRDEEGWKAMLGTALGTVPAQAQPR